MVNGVLLHYQYLGVTFRKGNPTIKRPIMENVFACYDTMLVWPSFSYARSRSWFIVLVVVVMVAFLKLGI